MAADAYTEIIQVRQRFWVASLCISLAFFAIGIWVMIRSNQDIDLGGGIITVGSALFSINVWLNRPGCSFLAITPEGLTVKYSGESSFFKWTEIERFGVAEIPLRRCKLHRAVGIRFAYSKKSLHLNRNGVCPQKRIRAGFDAVLLDNYGRECAELAKYLNQLRERYVNEPGEDI
jgi:hypothetical protein